MLAAYTHDMITPFTVDEATRAITDSLFSVIGAKPKPEVVALALAKTALETGRWRKIHCFNWGNIKCGQKFSGMYTCILLNEVIGGKVVWFAPEGQLAGGPGTALVGHRFTVPTPGSHANEWPTEPPDGYGHPQTRMRAYANKLDGAFDYIDFVAGGRYVDAWNELLEGDPLGYVRALKAKGYFTADETIYGRGVLSLFNEFRKRLEAPGAHVEEAAIGEKEYNLAASIILTDRAIDSAWEAVNNERHAALRDAGLTDEERKTLGYDTDPAPPPSFRQS